MTTPSAVKHGQCGITNFNLAEPWEESRGPSALKSISLHHRFPFCVVGRRAKIFIQMQTVRRTDGLCSRRIVPRGVQFISPGVREPKDHLLFRVRNIH